MRRQAPARQEQDSEDSVKGGTRSPAPDRGAGRSWRSTLVEGGLGRRALTQAPLELVCFFVCHYCQRR